MGSEWVREVGSWRAGGWGRKGWERAYREAGMHACPPPPLPLTPAHPARAAAYLPHQASPNHMKEGPTLLLIMVNPPQPPRWPALPPIMWAGSVVHCRRGRGEWGAVEGSLARIHCPLPVPLYTAGYFRWRHLNLWRRSTPPPQTG